MRQQDLSIRKRGRIVGIFRDVTSYEVRGASLAEVNRAIDLIRLRDSANGPINKANELDFNEVASITLARPLGIPTAIVYKHNGFYIGGGIFGPVWGRFSAEQEGDAVIVKDTIRGSPAYRFGHHTFPQGVQAIAIGIGRARREAANKPSP